MTTNHNINQLQITSAELKKALDHIEQAKKLLRLKPIAAEDKARFARVEDAALPAYEAVATLAEQRPDIIPPGLCNPSLMRVDLSDADALGQLIAAARELVELASDNRAAAVSDVVREGNEGYSSANRVADRDMDVKAAIEPLAKVFKSRSRNR